MDILNRVLSIIQAELGDDIFTEAKRAHFERQFRFEYGAEAHYIASLRAFEVAERQREVGRLIGLGLSDRQISDRLGISRWHACRLRQKLSPDTPAAGDSRSL
jgi:DNA-binding NarL/FixJ family response regulator